MSIVATIQRLPQDLQFPMLEFAEAIEQKLHSELAVRREDFLALQEAVQELAVAQHRTEERVEELTEAQRRTEERVSRLEVALIELAEAQRRTEETLNKLIKRVDRIEVKLGDLVGDNLERKYRERAFAYLGQILRPVHSVSLQDVLSDIEDRLSESEVDELLPLDVLLRGQARQVEGKPEV